ncbi:MAG: hypothetical protein L6455_05750 [Kiritimatiellae bacterium]|nr:hypothetical protein [Kiritimatiellia bacterium]
MVITVELAQRNNYFFMSSKIRQNIFMAMGIYGINVAVIIASVHGCITTSFFFVIEHCFGYDNTKYRHILDLPC